MPSDTKDDGPVFAIVEQMGHRRFGARVRDVTRFGAACMEAVVLLPGEELTTYVFPSSLLAVTVCTEAQARAANAYGGLGLPALASKFDENEQENNLPTVGYVQRPAAQRVDDVRALSLEGARVWTFRREDVAKLASGAGWASMVARAGYDHEAAEVRWYDDGSLVVACRERLVGNEGDDGSCDECGAGPQESCKPGCRVRLKLDDDKHEEG